MTNHYELITIIACHEKLMKLAHDIYDKQVYVF